MLTRERNSWSLRMDLDFCKNSLTDTCFIRSRFTRESMSGRRSAGILFKISEKLEPCTGLSGDGICTAGGSSGPDTGLLSAAKEVRPRPLPLPKDKILFNGNNLFVLPSKKQIHYSNLNSLSSFAFLTIELISLSSPFPSTCFPKNFFSSLSSPFNSWLSAYLSRFP